MFYRRQCRRHGKHRLTTTTLATSLCLGIEQCLTGHAIVMLAKHSFDNSKDLRTSAQDFMQEQARIQFSVDSYMVTHIYESQSLQSEINY